MVTRKVYNISGICCCSVLFLSLGKKRYPAGSKNKLLPSSMPMEAVMSESNEDFFEGKREWSKIKDEVLANYMKPYLAKVNKRGQSILLIDGYAGPGVFEDGSHGSPLIMCEKAEEWAKGNYHAIFINNERKYYDKLSREIQRKGWSKVAEARLGDTQRVLPEIFKTLKDQTVFLYLDPFGPTGCNFDLLAPFLNRNPSYSTEILLTMNMPGVHRLAARHVDEAGRVDEEKIRNYRLMLTRTFGGDYWQDILRQDAETAERDIQLIEAYPKASLWREANTIKYFIVFASRHRDALVLLNDIMVNAYFAGMHQADLAGGLWEEMDWREMRSISGLDHIILDTITKHPRQTRNFIWLRIVEQHFMRYLKSEYIATVKQLVQNRKLAYTSKTKWLNDDSILYLYHS
ncbi:MAG: three-Cys-motif partner protein TcmP [Chloroflexi bacterium]|nr:MAG: three-Cys-motif partner protein TcmP [Chloroflexota bacterium]